MSEKKSILERIKKQKKLLKEAYQIGYSDGGQDMNEKWLITSQKLISEFVNDLKNFEEFAEDLTDIEKFITAKADLTALLIDHTRAIAALGDEVQDDYQDCRQVRQAAAE